MTQPRKISTLHDNHGWQVPKVPSSASPSNDFSQRRQLRSVFSLVEVKNHMCFTACFSVTQNNKF